MRGPEGPHDLGRLKKLPRATPPERHISGGQLLEELQALPAEVLDRPAVFFTRAAIELAGNPANDVKWEQHDVVGVETTFRHVVIATEDDDDA